MDNLAVSDINSHVSGVAYNITRLGIFKAVYRRAHASVRRRGMRQADTEIIVNAHYETGAVRTVGKAGAAVYIRVTHKLACIICH